jgi:hypothetical protein
LPAEDHGGKDATNVVEFDEGLPSGRRTRSDAELRPLATMASRREQPITRNPPNEVVENRGFTEGAHGPPRLLRLRPSELEKKREEPYLEVNLAEKIHRPTPNYGHLAKPRPKTPGSLLHLLLYKDPTPLLSLELTATPPALASGWTGVSRATLNALYCSGEKGERKTAGGGLFKHQLLAKLIGATIHHGCVRLVEPSGM